MMLTIFVMYCEHFRHNSYYVLQTPVEMKKNILTEMQINY